MTRFGLETASRALALIADEQLAKPLQRLAEQDQLVNQLADVGFWLLDEIEAIAEQEERRSEGEGPVEWNRYLARQAATAVHFAVDRIQSPDFISDPMQAEVWREIREDADPFGEAADPLVRRITRSFTDFGALRRSESHVFQSGVAGGTPRIDGALAMLSYTGAARPHRGVTRIAGGVRIQPGLQRDVRLDAVEADVERVMAALTASDAMSHKRARTDVLLALLSYALTCTGALVPGVNPTGDMFLAVFQALVAISRWTRA